MNDDAKPMDIHPTNMAETLRNSATHLEKMADIIDADGNLAGLESGEMKWAMVAYARARAGDLRAFADIADWQAADAPAPPAPECRHPYKIHMDLMTASSVLASCALWPPGSPVHRGPEERKALYRIADQLLQLSKRYPAPPHMRRPFTPPVDPEAPPQSPAPKRPGQACG